MFPEAFPFGRRRLGLRMREPHHRRHTGEQHDVANLAKPGAYTFAGNHTTYCTVILRFIVLIPKIITCGTPAVVPALSSNLAP